MCEEIKEVSVEDLELIVKKLADAMHFNPTCDREVQAQKSVYIERNENAILLVLKSVYDKPLIEFLKGLSQKLANTNWEVKRAAKNNGNHMRYMEVEILRRSDNAKNY